MKTKIIVTLLCAMLLMTGVVFAVPSKNTMIASSETQPVSPVSDPVPIWQMGDSWTYKVDNISINFQQNNQTIYLTLTIDKLPLTVTSVSGDAYTLSFSTKGSGHGIIDVETDQGPVNLEITFTGATVNGIVMIEKTGLGIQSMSATLHGFFHLTVIEFPQKLPFTHLPIPVTMNMSATNFTVNGDVHSLWLNVIHFVNMFLGLFGQDFLPPEIESLLPVVNIKDALTTFGLPNVFSVPEVPELFVCGDKTAVAVPAGTFDAYDIAVAGGIGSIYYAPTAGNVIKISGNFHDIIPYIQDLNMELTSTTYQP